MLDETFFFVYKIFDKYFKSALVNSRRFRRHGIKTVGEEMLSIVMRSPGIVSNQGRHLEAAA